MKKYLLVMALALFVLSGCHKNSGCQQPFTPEEIPELNADGYNTCEAIYKNYTYLICGSEANYPYWSHKGDTISVCGYLAERWNGDLNLLPLYDRSDNLDHHKYGIYVSLDDEEIEMLIDNIDFTRKCYVTGRLMFYSLYTNGDSYYMTPGISDVKMIFFE